MSNDNSRMAESCQLVGRSGLSMPGTPIGLGRRGLPLVNSRLVQSDRVHLE